jgi:hypothetical protein
VVQRFLKPLWKERFEIDKESVDLPRSIQLSCYKELANMAARINQFIHDKQDREALFIRIVDQLVLLTKLNNITNPNPQDTEDKYADQAQRLDQALEKLTLRMQKLREEQVSGSIDEKEYQKIDEELEALDKEFPWLSKGAKG